MEQAVGTPGGAATDPVGVAAAVDAAPDTGPVPDDQPTADRRRLPDWWYDDHPVFVPLAGFFVGIAYLILVPGTYVAVVNSLFGFERGEELFPFVLLTLVVPIGLLVPKHTRKFGGYMLFGVLATAIVVLGVAALVLTVLIARDS